MKKIYTLLTITTLITTILTTILTCTTTYCQQQQTNYKTIIIYKLCPICLGKPLNLCTHCSGSGKIKIYSPFSNFNNSSTKPYKLEKCPHCNGTGIIDKCYYCSGTGKIKADSITF